MSLHLHIQIGRQLELKVCPSGISEWNADNVAMGNLSILNLGAIEIYEVVFGNIEGENGMLHIGYCLLLLAQSRLCQ